jgi:hypothetical protein
MFRRKGIVKALIEAGAVMLFLLGIIYGVYKLANIDGKFAQSRNVQREISLQTIADAIYSYSLSTGKPINSLGEIRMCSQSFTRIGTTEPTSTGEWINLQKELQGNFIPILPKDPSGGNDADTGYTICKHDSNRLELNAPRAELGQKISIIK